MDKLLQFLDVLPGVELVHIVVADEVIELGLGVAGLVVTHRIDGEGWACTVKLGVVQLKSLFPFQGRMEELLPVLRRGRRLVELVRRDLGQDENDLIQMEEFPCVASQDQVAVMNGIEGSSVETEFFRL